MGLSNRNAIQFLDTGIFLQKVFFDMPDVNQFTALQAGFVTQASIPSTLDPQIEPLPPDYVAQIQSGCHQGSAAPGSLSATPGHKLELMPCTEHRHIQLSLHAACRSLSDPWAASEAGQHGSIGRNKPQDTDNCSLKDSVFWEMLETCYI